MTTFIETTLSTTQTHLNTANALASNLRQSVIGHEGTLVMPGVYAVLGLKVAFTGMPGLAKTQTGLSVAHSIGGNFGLVQCVSDMLPKDLTGFDWFNQQTGQWEFMPSALFNDVVLFDELNRAPGRTHSALVSVLQSSRVTVGRTTYDLTRWDGPSTPLIYMATWNPTEHAGTEILPDNIRDRFDIYVVVDYPDLEDELIIATGGYLPPEELQPVIGREQIIEMREAVERIIRTSRARDTELAVKVVHATRTHPAFRAGASPRGSQSLLKAAACSALCRGSNVIEANDIWCTAHMALRHRVEIDFEAYESAAGTTGLSEREFIDNTLTEILNGIWGVRSAD